MSCIWISRCGGIGIRARLKIVFPREYGFDSHQRHHYAESFRTERVRYVYPLTYLYLVGTSTIMTSKKYLSGLLIAGLVSFSAWLMVVAKLNPFESTALALVLFFISLFFSLLCTFTLVGFYIRRYIDRGELQHYHMSTSLRQAILLAFCVDASLLLLVFSLLTWWSGLLLVVIITLVEFYMTRSD